ncbi:hypothetical protein [Sphingomonas sp. BK235]|uniref:hypothetical protein n=1 Tax=Sphingomonas sp. BK235 TaxID=2512131 RepID=UPI0010E51E17|nr:hypothetical protein [Sphingomonas sp. BK235]TCP35032.1 hypothetical protein EV292_103462 [Sphingomonas sp. BK235]
MTDDSRSNDEPLSQAIARARTSFAAGDGVEQRVVALWLASWGTPQRKPFGEWLATWDG